MPVKIGDWIRINQNGSMRLVTVQRVDSLGVSTRRGFVYYREILEVRRKSVPY